MIGYCPLEDEPVVQTPLPPSPPPIKSLEETECNYIIMFFILGVISMAITDILSHR